MFAISPPPIPPAVRAIRVSNYGMSPFDFNLFYAGLVWVAVAAVAIGLARLSAAPFGRVLRAIREDETVAAVAGKRTLLFKLQAFAIGAAVLGLAGGLYAHFNAYVAPDAFQPLVTIYVVLALVAGGTGRMAGAVLGAVLVVALQEGARFGAAALPGLSPVQVASVRAGSIGVALILMLHLNPNGLLPERAALCPAMIQGRHEPGVLIEKTFYRPKSAQQHVRHTAAGKY